MTKKIIIILFSLLVVQYSKGQSVDYRQFLGKSISATIPTRLNMTYFDDYIQENGEILRISIFTDTLKNHHNLEALILNSERQNFARDTAKVFIKFVNKLSFNFQGKEIKIIKYVCETNKTFQVKSKVFQRNQNWQEIQIQDLLNIRLVIQSLKSDMFWAFYNKSPSGYKEIDSIKSQFKNSEGILDIDKLGAYLKTKPAALAKYCDF
jgi:hypothetical protein